MWAVFGTPGADNQVQINLQVLTAMIDFGLDPQQAAEMPRWTSNVPGQYANWPHDGDDALTIEQRFPRRCGASWRAAVTRSRRSAISKDRAASRSSAATRATGMLLAGSDPRRDGGRSPGEDGSHRLWPGWLAAVRFSGSLQLYGK